MNISELTNWPQAFTIISIAICIAAILITLIIRHS
jgi:hypothetical protein